MKAEFTMLWVAVLAILVTFGLMVNFWPAKRPIPAEPATIQWDEAEVTEPDTVADSPLESGDQEFSGATYPFYRSENQADAHRLIHELRQRVQELKQIMEEEFGIYPVDKEE